MTTLVALPTHLLTLGVAFNLLVLCLASSWCGWMIARVCGFKPWAGGVLGLAVPMLGPLAALGLSAAHGRVRSSGIQPARGLADLVGTGLTVGGPMLMLLALPLPLLEIAATAADVGVSFAPSLAHPAPLGAVFGTLAAALAATIGTFVRGGSRFTLPLVPVVAAWVMTCLTAALAFVMAARGAESALGPLGGRALERILGGSSSLNPAELGGITVVVEPGPGSWVFMIGVALMGAGVAQLCRASLTAYVSGSNLGGAIGALRAPALEQGMIRALGEASIGGISGQAEGGSEQRPRAQTAGSKAPPLEGITAPPRPIQRSDEGRSSKDRYRGGGWT